MSNVRPLANQMRNVLHTVEVHRTAAAEGRSLLRRVEPHVRSAGVGRPSFGGRRTVSSCQGFLQRRRGLSVLRRPAHRRLGSDSTHRPNEGVGSASSGNQARQRIMSLKRSQSSNSLSRSATHEATTNTNASLGSHRAVGAGALVGEAAEQVKIGARSVLSRVGPNPSVEGTSNSGLRPLSAAPHVKR